MRRDLSPSLPVPFPICFLLGVRPLSNVPSSHPRRNDVMGFDVS